MHGFIWLEGAPNIDNLNWRNHDEIKIIQKYFDSIIHAWNPRGDPHQ